MADYKLKYTAADINRRLGDVDKKLETVSWDDLTEKPFGDCQVEIFPETQFNITKEITSIKNNNIFEFIDGDLYVVTINDKPYEVIASSGLLGNGTPYYMDKIPENYEGVPFFVKNDTIYVYSKDTGLCSIKIVHSNGVNQLDEKYIPYIPAHDGMFTINAISSYNYSINSYTVSTDKTFSEMLEAHHDGRNIRIMLRIEDSQHDKYCYTLSFISENIARFVCINVWGDCVLRSLYWDRFNDKITLYEEKSIATEEYVDCSVIEHETSYNQLKDKPFYYDEYTVKDVCVQRLTWLFPCDEEFIVSSFPNENEECRLIFDGTYYILKSFTTSMAVGNTSLLQDISMFDYIEKEDTGEPFCIVCVGSDTMGSRYRMYTEESGVHAFRIEIVKYTPCIKQLDEKFIPDTIARIEDITILPIERLSDFGGNAECNSSGVIDLQVSASMQNPTNYLFKTAIDGNVKSLKLSFINSDNTKQLLSIKLFSGSNTLYHITNDVKDKCVIIYELYFGNTTEIYYDDSGNFSKRVSFSYVTTYDVLDKVNYQIKQGSYTPSNATDIVTKEYVDNLSQSFILNSSTEGSEKQFMITVDDNGTLTATLIE